MEKQLDMQLGLNAIIRSCNITSYALGQSAPMVSVVWGILAWKEFRHPSKVVILLLIGMFVLYTSAITCLALSK